ncbi:MAG: peptidoglycan-binding domain-containing protein, partial [Candidatus Woesebacteria bacterium]|nr:peptidoglycan-binding domain-containing protein [Candidatus Woesebacteria bacterium]
QGTLTFDKPVKILLNGVNVDVGYKPAGSDTWTKITTDCTAGSYDAPTGAVFPGECKIRHGNDTKILTYHFTSFGGLDVIPPPSQGSPYPAPIPPATPATPAVPGVSPAVPATPAAGKVLGATTIAGCGNRTTGFSVVTGQSCIGNSPAGQVLGAEKFNFTKLIKQGSKSNEVIELQKFLNTAGYNVGTADGKFGAKTKAALIKFQVANKLKGDGVVGLKVRALLNK